MRRSASPTAPSMCSLFASVIAGTTTPNDDLLDPQVHSPRAMTATVQRALPVGMQRNTKETHDI